MAVHHIQIHSCGYSCWMCRMPPWSAHTQACQGSGGLHGSEGAPHMEQSLLRPPRSSHRLQTLWLLVVFGLQASSFQPQQKRGHAVAERCLPLQTFQLLIKPTQLVVIVKQTNKQNKKKGERNGEGSKVRRGSKNLLQDLWKLHTLLCSQHGMSTAHSWTVLHFTAAVCSLVLLFALLPRKMRFWVCSLKSHEQVSALLYF